MTPSEGQNLTLNLDFRGHISTFRAKYVPKSGPFKAKNKALTTPEQRLKNFQKVLKIGFFMLKMVKMALSEGQNLTLFFDFRGHLSTF